MGERAVNQTPVGGRAHLLRTHFLVELHGLVGAAVPHAVPGLGQHPHAAAQALGPSRHAEHPQAQSSTLGPFDHGRRRFVVFHRDPVDLHHIVSDLEAPVAGRTVGYAVLHHHRAVADNGETEATVQAWVYVDLRKNKEKT